ncbi:MAG: hypothetical protein O2960_25160 [Verrucomicrobia bacterium]|nr:hypothetical protein [Verrucomicrobiota bacterium]
MTGRVTYPDLRKDGFIDLAENTPGLDLTVDEAASEKFKMTE